MRHYIYPILLTVLLAVSAGAADYYVSTAGNDSNAGSQASPWRTVGKINGLALAAGDRVFFAGGQVFTDAGLVLGSGDAGNAGNRVVIGSYGSGRATIKPATAHGCDIYNVAGITIQNLIFEGPGLTTSTTAGLSAYCDLNGGVRLSGLSIVGCEFRQFQNGVLIGAWNNSFSGFQDVLIDTCVAHDNRREGISTYGWGPGSATTQSHRNITISNCEVYGNTGDPGKTNSHSGSGIIIAGTIGGLVDRCYAHHNGGSAGNPSGGGPVGIWTWDSVNVTIQRCLVHDQKTTPGVMDGGGFDIDGGSVNAVIQYCYSYNNEGCGYLIAQFINASPMTNGTIRYNISWKDGRRAANNMASGVHFWNDGSNPAANCANVKVYNNTIYADGAVGGPAIHSSGPMTGHSLRNNVIIVAGGAKFVNIVDYAGAFTFTGNSYWAADGNYAGGWAWNGATSGSLAAWRSTTGSPETMSGSPVGLQVNPLLVAAVAGAQPTSIAAMEAMTAFNLQDGSPLIDTGLNLTSATFGSLAVGSRDFSGNAIPAGSGYDIGAHEKPVTSTVTAAAITSQPGNATVTAPTTATFTVSASGNPAPTYQWSSAPSGSATFNAIGGATSASYSTGATSTGMSGTQYRCVATNSAGSATSNTATLTVAAISGDPTIPMAGLISDGAGPYAGNLNTTADKAYDGSTATFYDCDNADGYTGIDVGAGQEATVTAIRYWARPSYAARMVGGVFEGSNAASSGFITLGTVASASDSAWTTLTVTGASPYRYLRYRGPSGGYCNVAEIEFRGTVQGTTTATIPTFTTQPIGQSVAAPATATFTVAASGSPAPTYQWSSAPSGSSTFTALSGATTASYTTGATSTAMSGIQYRCVATNSAGSATSNTAILTVNAAATAPAITSQPGNATVTEPTTATFTVAASGNPAPTYQWSSAPSGSATFTALSGATSASYSTGATSTGMSGTQYRCVATNSAGSATSSVATLTVTATATAMAPAFTTQPSNATVTAPATATFTVAASGSPAPTYQWNSAPSGSTTFAAISGATSASYTTAATSTAMSGTQYRCVATNSAGSATSNTATLTFSDWSTMDIGAVAAVGSSAFSGGIWTLKGSGADIWGTNDEFRFTYLPVSGDVMITARVTGLQNTNRWAKAGVMVRETLGANSRHAMTCLSASKGPSFRRRLTTAGSSVNTGGPALSVPGWVRLERVGNLFISSVSSNGTTWTEIRRETISMAVAVQVGLAVTSNADGTLCTATFSDVTVVSAPVAVN